MTTLDRRTSSLVTLSVLASRPQYRQELHDELRLVRDNQYATADEIYEAFLQLYLFAGFPAALEAMRALAHTQVRPDRQPDEINYDLYLSKGDELYQRVYAVNAPRVRQEMLRLSPDLAAWALLEGYGKTLAREGLGLITRELCIVGILTQLEWTRQLFSHILGARNVGASKEAIHEACRIGALGDEKKLQAAEQLMQKLV